MWLFLHGYADMRWRLRGVSYDVHTSQIYTNWAKKRYFKLNYKLNEAKSISFCQIIYWLGQKMLLYIQLYTNSAEKKHDIKCSYILTGPMNVNLNPITYWLVKQMYTLDSIINQLAIKTLLYLYTSNTQGVNLPHC